jgi:protein-disulfide isomerase
VSDPTQVKTPDPIRLPKAIPAQRPTNEVVQINRSTLNYVMIAFFFFFAGLIVSNILFAASTGDLVSNVRSAAATAAGQAANQAVATGFANARSSGALAVAAVPTETPYVVPRQAVDLAGAPSWGPADSKVTIVEFGDFQCPYCEYFFQNTYLLLKQNYGTRIHFVFRDLPLPTHPDAFPAALAAECAYEQNKFWEYHDMLYSHQENLSSDALTSDAEQVGLDVKQFTDCFKSQKYQDRIISSIKAGQGYKARGTPTFYINGVFYEGALAYGPLAKYIDALLNQAS